MYLVTPSSQYTRITPYSTRTFDYLDAPDSHYFLARVSNSVLAAIGNDIVLSGLEPTSINFTNNDVNFVLAPGQLIQDSTLIQFPESIQVDIANANVYNEHVNVFLVYCYWQWIHTVDENKAKIGVCAYNTETHRVSDITSFNRPISWDYNKQRTILCAFNVVKDASGNITDVTIIKHHKPIPILIDTEEPVEERIYYIGGFNLTDYKNLGILRLLQEFNGLKSQDGQLVIPDLSDDYDNYPGIVIDCPGDEPDVALIYDSDDGFWKVGYTTWEYDQYLKILTQDGNIWNQFINLIKEEGDKYSSIYVERPDATDDKGSAAISYDHTINKWVIRYANPDIPPERIVTENGEMMNEFIVLEKDDNDDHSSIFVKRPYADDDKGYAAIEFNHNTQQWEIGWENDEERKSSILVHSIFDDLGDAVPYAGLEYEFSIVNGNIVLTHDNLVGPDDIDTTLSVMENFATDVNDFSDEENTVQPVTTYDPDEINIFELKEKKL